MGNMVPKELLGNEEDGKGIPFLGSQKKGIKKRKVQTRLLHLLWLVLHIVGKIWWGRFSDNWLRIRCIICSCVLRFAIL